ncbi:MAG: SDR family oxidoreductase, partial [bacterium]|nr:SDR family oxidoreductase [bacterium]
MPAREAWDAWLAEHGDGGDDDNDNDNDDVDVTRRAITRVRALEAAGAEVLVASADVADEAQMRAVVEQASARFGTLHGVVHLAGVLAQDSFKTVQLTGREECELHFGPKVYGLYVLERVLEGLDLDFCILYSSLSA